MAPQNVVRVDDASYAAIVAYRQELQRRTGCKVSLSRAWASSRPRIRERISAYEHQQGERRR